MDERLKKQLDFLIEIDKMKNILRQTLLADKSRRENDAEHSWHFAVMAMILFEHASSQDKLNLNRIIKMALIHDLIEIYAGDTFAFDIKGYESKKERENNAADKLFSLLPSNQGDEIRSLWEEFEEMKTPDSIYANSIDRLQPFINNFKTDGHTWVLYGITKDKIYERMQPIKQSMPKLWEFVEYVVDDSMKKGYIKS